MNREIKFRVWDGQSMRHTFDGWSNEVDIMTDVWKVISEYGYHTMQFTGLHDKDGKEIYENDVVRLHEYVDVETEVVFHRGAFCIKGFNFNPAKCTVIGNRFEHPHLIS